jgi:hypothetical protein
LSGNAGGCYAVQECAVAIRNAGYGPGERSNDLLGIVLNPVGRRPPGFDRNDEIVEHSAA